MPALRRPTTDAIEVRVPAKVNIRLKVIGRRPDGYHELSGIMVPVGLFDDLRVSRTLEAGVFLRCRGRPVPRGRNNLAYRAADAFLSRIGGGGAALRLVKRIPAAAGLGGGSSDAAGTLAALNRLWGSPLDEAELGALALGLGADVPFFLKGAPCAAGGIGEILKPIDNWPKFWYVIVSPRISVSTAEVFASLKLELTTHENNSINQMIQAQPLDVAGILENDLETVTAVQFPVIGTIKKSLKDAGALGALMSGSGPSVFGIFESKPLAERAGERLGPRMPGDVFVAEGIP